MMQERMLSQDAEYHYRNHHFALVTLTPTSHRFSERLSIENRDLVLISR